MIFKCRKIVGFRTPLGELTALPQTPLLILVPPPTKIKKSPLLKTPICNEKNWQNGSLLSPSKTGCFATPLKRSQGKDNIIQGKKMSCNF